MTKDISIKQYFEEHKRLQRGVFENTKTGRRVLVFRSKALDDTTIFGQYYSKTSGDCSRFFDAVDNADKNEWALIYKNDEIK